MLGVSASCMTAMAEPQNQIPALEAPGEGQNQQVMPTVSTETTGLALSESSEADPDATETPAETAVSEEPAELSGPGEGIAEAVGGTISNATHKPEEYSQIGPGMGDAVNQNEKPSQSQGQAQGEIQEFTSMTVENPVVKTVEKYSFEQMEADIQALQQRYGTSHMQVTSIGTSADGRKIYDIIVGNPNAGKHILIQGAIHAREYANPLLMMKQIEDALAFYDTGAYHGRKLSDLLNQVAVSLCYPWQIRMEWL